MWTKHQRHASGDDQKIEINRNPNRKKSKRMFNNQSPKTRGQPSGILTRVLT